MTEERLDERVTDDDGLDPDLRLDEREEQIGKPPLRGISGGKDAGPDVKVKDTPPEGADGPEAA